MCTSIAGGLVLSESESDSADMQLIATVLCSEDCCMFLCSLLGIRQACMHACMHHVLFAPQLNSDCASMETRTVPDGC